MWPRGKTIEDTPTIGEEDEGFYKLKGKPKQELVQELIEPIELWHIRLAHVQYRALPMVSKEVSGFPEIQENTKGICKG